MNATEMMEKAKGLDIMGRVKRVNKWYDELTRTKRIALAMALGSPVLLMRWFGIAYFMAIILISMVGSGKEE